MTTQQAPSATRDHSAERRNMRAVANNVILHLHPTKVPADAVRLRYTWGLGGIATTLVITLLATGVLLMFRYEPSVENAYASIEAMEQTVWFGSLIRAVHHWAGNGLVIVAFLHLLRVFYTGGFMQGRTLNWMIGIGLLLLVLAFNFTGYLLPWDQLAYWAITVGTSLIGYVPLISKAISNALLGGPEVGQKTLTNFYAIHVAVLPMTMMAVMLYHFWRIRKDGGISQPKRDKRRRVERVTTLPHLVWREVAAAAAVIAALLLWSMVVPAPLEAQADPNYPLNPAKSAWYFLGVQELLLHMQVLAALTLATSVLIALLLLPLLDNRQPELIGIYFRTAMGRKLALVGTLLAAVFVPLLVVADEWWIDLVAWLPTWPLWLATGLLPLLLSLAGLAGVYGVMRRWGFGRNGPTHSEAVVGLFSFVMMSLIVLTIIGYVFRGENMALIWPF